jgi:hypothetical protein
MGLTIFFNYPFTRKPWKLLPCEFSVNATSNNAQAGLVSVVVGAGAGWFAIYVNGKATKIKNKD